MNVRFLLRVVDFDRPQEGHRGREHPAPKIAVPVFNLPDAALDLLLDRLEPRTQRRELLLFPSRASPKADT